MSISVLQSKRSVSLSFAEKKALHLVKSGMYHLHLYSILFLPLAPLYAMQVSVPFLSNFQVFTGMVINIQLTHSTVALFLD